jgi:hypothetical protein
VTRFDDFGLAGYERGDGYRAGEGYRHPPPTLRGFLRGLAILAVGMAVAWLLWETVGERVAHLVMWLAVAVGYVWRGWQNRRYPLAYDEYATDAERDKVRRDSIWTFVTAVIWAGVGVSIYVHEAGHVR